MDAIKRKSPDFLDEENVRKHQKFCSEPTETPYEIPKEILEKIMEHITDIQDIHHLELVNSIFQAAQPWKNVRKLEFAVTRHPDYLLHIRQNKTEKRREGSTLEDALEFLPTIWRKCSHLNELEFADINLYFSPDGSLSEKVRAFVGQIAELQRRAESRRIVGNIVLKAEESYPSRGNQIFKTVQEIQMFLDLVSACSHDLTVFSAFREGWLLASLAKGAKQALVSALLQCNNLKTVIASEWDIVKALRRQPNLTKLSFSPYRYTPYSVEYVTETSFAQDFQIKVSGTFSEPSYSSYLMEDKSWASQCTSLTWTIRNNEDTDIPMFSNDVLVYHINQLFTLLPNMKSAHIVFLNENSEAGNNVELSLLETFFLKVIPKFFKVYGGAENLRDLRVDVHVKDFMMRCSSSMARSIQQKIPDLHWEMVPHGDTDLEGREEASASNGEGFDPQRHTHMKLTLGNAECGVHGD